MSKLKATINEKLQEANKTDGATRQALVESTDGSLRAWCEVAVERQLLQGVVTRYQPMVRLTTLAQAEPAVLKSATDAIVPMYERACRAYLSQRPERPVRPSNREMQELSTRLDFSPG